MPLFAEDIDNCEELEKWVKSMNVSYNSDVNVKNTPDRGVGLFFKPTKTNGEQTELLRIPHMSSFNIYTIRKLCDDKLEADDKKVLKRCLQIVFTICYSASESLILIAYMIGLLMICEKRKIHASVGDDRRWLDDMKGYIGILMKTKVGNLYTDQQNVLEDFLAAFKGNAVLKSSITDVISEKWIEVETAINEEFSEEFERIKVSEILQICSAVRSRVLEIPREVETEVCGEEEEKEGRDSDEETNDDFYVDVTLVPVLDFVNHDNHMRNAHFDVDRDSKDIVLYYENDKANTQGTNEEAGGAGEEKKEVEVFISYDKYEDIHFMFANYGFIPQSRGTKVIELPILGYNENSKLDNYKASMRLYEIKQSPNVQFAVEFAETGEICDVKILDEEFYSYLIFDDGLKWREEEDEQVAENEENEDTEEEQPKDEDAGSAATLQLEFERGYRRCERLVNQLSDERYNELQHSFYDYLGEYLLKFSKRVSIFATITREYELPNGETTNILKLLEFYGQLCKAMRKILVARHKFESHPLADPYTASGYLSRRMLPLYNFENILAGVEMGDLTL